MPLLEPMAMKYQLGYLVEEPQRTNSVKPHFTRGPILAKPSSLDGYFGPPPDYRFIHTRVDFTVQLRKLPSIPNREQAIHYAEHESKNEATVASAERAVDLILEIKQNDKIEGLIGYSKGATVAAYVMTEEQRRYEEHGRPVRVKCAVFISGWPAIDIHLGNVIVPTGLDDEEYIPILTCHVIGAENAFLERSNALDDLCNVDNAEYFDHGGGHIILRHPTTLRELGDVMRNMIQESLDWEITTIQCWDFAGRLVDKPVGCQGTVS
ncbi:hypothetical protein BDV27DRAFT_152133 [Aspergillus caelatus]|uniref:Serine hydrolase domain-containing protein n=1 Tax=Aspergillus caelatus TaxID=61420 RepID=A0A5N7AP83_9EURO|nr:uncharacterized protein BDV27DRAFT_152133 [Aspergillus caelatus]KAE8370540.1 hypothetical protein BDV27DRAFT_152133 [Aspergillus caelatus]